MAIRTALVRDIWRRPFQPRETTPNGRRGTVSNRTPNIGPVTFRKLLLQFSTARAALDPLPELARRGGLREFKPFPAARGETESERQFYGNTCPGS